MTVTWPILITLLALACWIRALARFDHEALICAMVLAIAAATLWLVEIIT